MPEFSYIPSIVGAQKGNWIYYDVVTSCRLAGKPRITHQAYLGTAERLAQLVRDKAAPVPLQATARDCGRTTLITNRLAWTPAQVAVAYKWQRHVERVFRGLQGGQ